MMLPGTGEKSSLIRPYSICYNASTMTHAAQSSAAAQHTIKTLLWMYGNEAA